MNIQEFKKLVANIPEHFDDCELVLADENGEDVMQPVFNAFPKHKLGWFEQEK